MVIEFIRSWLQSVRFMLPLPVAVVPAGDCGLVDRTLSQPCGAWRRLLGSCMGRLKSGRLFFSRQVRALPWELVTLPCSLTGQIL